ncbi:hypothetical protein QYM36_017063 [Artemia franciscana]|uniref:Endonuclease/exonuclease/phosphatase domain-containing protein n=1 Tax=Artemia franciscana TaxID=6661 RepID=A0AA88HGL4_ARTSF|nr:hypothetical protein QYM36_017063 [Artemia franciscana]
MGRADLLARGRIFLTLFYMNSKLAVVGRSDRLAALKGKPLNLSLLSETFNVFGLREDNTFSEIKPSSYISPEEINRLEDNSKRIGFLNTQGLISSIDELTRLLPRNQTDILGVCETFSDTTKHNVKIPGYNFIEKIRQNHGKGGLGLFLKEGVHFKRLPELGKYDSEKLCEFSAVECRSGTKKFQICIVYKPLSVPIPLFVQPLESLLASLDDKEVVIMEDFNLNLLKYDENSQTTEFITLMTSKSLTPSCTIPTRVSLTSSTLIDKIFLMIPAKSSKKEKKDQRIHVECRASSHAMEEVEDALEVHEKEFSQIFFSSSSSFFYKTFEERKGTDLRKSLPYDSLKKKKISNMNHMEICTAADY